MSRVLVLGGTMILVEANEVITSLLSRGVYGVPHTTPEYAATAQANGYGSDVARMNRCHEIGHSALAHWLGLEASPVMQRLVNGETESTELTALEEDAVQAIERFANALGVNLENLF